jgi:hypothetical protein
VDGNWIKLHKSILKWEWFEDSNTFKVFVYLLLTANYEDKNWMGVVVRRGQLVTSLPSLKKNTRVSVQSLRTILNRLKSTGEITVESTNRFSIITIVNYNTYQDVNCRTNRRNNRPTNIQSTGNQQATNRQPTLNKEYKEIKNTTMYEIAFEKLWETYPNRKNQSKRKAYEAYLKYIKNRISLKVILEAIEKQKKSKAWLKDDGQFIPHCATWINGCMWESESDEDDLHKKKIEKKTAAQEVFRQKQEAFCVQYAGYIRDAEPEALQKRVAKDPLMRYAVQKLRPEAIT